MTSNTDDTQLVTLVLVVLGAFVILPIFFMGFGMMGGMWGGGMGESATPGWILLVGVVVPLLFLTAIIGAGYFIYRAITRMTAARIRHWKNSASRTPAVI